MASSLESVKHLSLKDIHKVIDSLGDFSEKALTKDSVVMVINSTGEVTFSSCTWKLFSEVGFSNPLTKFINNAALNYTKLCGDDCKHFLFILKEMFNIIYSKISGREEIFARKNLISEVCQLKHSLPCIFDSIKDTLNVLETKSNSFSEDLSSLVLTFMLSRFSTQVSKVLSTLICDFIEKINRESNSLKLSLEYVISHFDIFCCKILSSVRDSKVSKGIFLYKKCIPSDFIIENCKFVVVWDLSMKLETDCVSWKILDESFIPQLNSLHVYQKIFEYFKSQNILLLLTPSVSNNNLKLLCKKNGIFLFDHLEKEEIECILTCFQLYALENLNESLESQHIGNLSSAKAFIYKQSHFLHLECMNSVRLFSAHHMLLSAPFNSIWKEYYSECLNCCKMIHQWLKSDVNSYYLENNSEDTLNKSMLKLSVHSIHKNHCICDEIRTNFGNEMQKFTYINIMKSCQSNRNLLAPCVWEFLFKNILTKVPEKFELSCSFLLQALDFAILKSLTNRIGIPLAHVKDVENMCAEFVKTCKFDDTNFLEPIICKEIMISSILDLLLQLLKIESIIFTK